MKIASESPTSKGSTSSPTEAANSERYRPLRDQPAANEAARALHRAKVTGNDKAKLDPANHPEANGKVEPPTPSPQKNSPAFDAARQRAADARNAQKEARRSGVGIQAAEKAVENADNQLANFSARAAAKPLPPAAAAVAPTITPTASLSKTLASLPKALASSTFLNPGIALQAAGVAALTATGAHGLAQMQQGNHREAGGMFTSTASAALAGGIAHARSAIGHTGQQVAGSLQGLGHPAARLAGVLLAGATGGLAGKTLFDSITAPGTPPAPMAPVPTAAQLASPNGIPHPITDPAILASVPAPPEYLKSALAAAKTRALAPRTHEYSFTLKEQQTLRQHAASTDLEWAVAKVKNLLPNAPRPTVLGILTYAMGLGIEGGTDNINHIKAGQKVTLSDQAIESVVAHLQAEKKLDARQRLTGISDSGSLIEIRPLQTPRATTVRGKNVT